MPSAPWRVGVDEHAAQTHAESWAVAVTHLRRLGYDVRWCVPAEVAARLAAAA